MIASVLQIVNAYQVSAQAEHVYLPVQQLMVSDSTQLVVSAHLERNVQPTFVSKTNVLQIAVPTLP